MYDSIFVSEKVLDKSVHHCAAAWTAFASSCGYYEHPDSTLIVLRVEKNVCFFSREEVADEDIRFQRFNVDFFEFYLRLVEAAIAQRPQNEASAEMNAARTSGCAGEADDA